MMLQTWFDQFAARTGIPTDFLAIAGVLGGATILFIGLVMLVSRPDYAAQRIAASSDVKRKARQDKALLIRQSDDVNGLLKAFVPTDRKGRSELQLKLQQAGFTSPSALYIFTMLRIVFGVLLPLTFLCFVVASRTSGIELPYVISSRLQGLSILHSYIILTLLIGLGYFSPMKVLNDRVAERRQKIEYAFPNALDLMRIAVESGLGFDAAMTRVANELAEVSPEVAYEFLTVQRQIAAGRPRDEAMHDMADRCGVEMVRSFSTVVQQSLRFGSSISDALTSYADELRAMRENKAQEMANKLPVKMSAVLGLLMLPVLIILAVGPTLIRYTELFGQ